MKAKKLASILLAVSLIFAMMATTAHAASFGDIPVGAYYEDAVTWAAKNQVTSGTSATTFSPDMKLERAQIVTFLWAMAGKPTQFGANAAKFTDVKRSDYFYHAVGWAVKYGITAGTSDKTFSPKHQLTMAEMVVFMHKAAESGQIGATVDVTGAGKLKKISGTPYYKDSFNWANEREYLAGIPEFAKNNNTFKPKLKVTRAMAVYLLWEMKTGNYMNTRVENMVQSAQSHIGSTASTFGFDGHWCDQFVQYCARGSGTGLAGQSSEYPILGSGDCGDLVGRFLEHEAMYISGYFHDNSYWLDRMRYWGYDMDNQIEMTKDFMPRRGDIVFFQYGGYGEEDVGVKYVVAHVGIVTGAKKSGTNVILHTVEGNTSGWTDSCVAAKDYTIDMASGKISGTASSYVVGFGRVQ